MDDVTATDANTWQFKMNTAMGGVPGAMGWAYRGLWVFQEEGVSAVIGKREDIGQDNYIGSGPYKLSKWDVGDSVVLTRNEDYVPRNEPGTYLAGAKIAYVDTITWLEIPDEETKIAGLKTGEWDVVDGAGLDHFGPLSADPNMNISMYGFHKSFLGISHQEPPTGNAKIRQAILVSLDVEELMSGLGPSDLWFLCPAIYYCNTPLETDIGASEWYNQNDVPRAKKLLEEGGYNGEPIRIMNPSDYATIQPLGPVLKSQLEAIGMNVEMPAMDWATLISKIYDKGWNLFTSWGTHNSFGHPLHDLNATEGGTGYGGGFTFPKMIEARENFAMATDPKEQMGYVEELQMLYFTKIPRIYLGQFSSIYPHRSYVKNLSVPSYPLYFNVWLEK
jgi:peptide/nickel transport system substrate-binding protein